MASSVSFPVDRRSSPRSRIIDRNKSGEAPARVRNPTTRLCPSRHLPGWEDACRLDRTNQLYTLDCLKVNNKTSQSGLPSKLREMSAFTKTSDLETVRSGAKGEKNFCPIALPWRQRVAANKWRVNARRSTAGLARPRGWLGRGRFRGTLGEARGTSARGGAGRSPGPTRWWLARPRRCGCGSRTRAPATAPWFACPASGSPLAAPGGKEYLAPSTNARRCGRPLTECPQGVGGRDPVGRCRGG